MSAEKRQQGRPDDTPAAPSDETSEQQADANSSAADAGLREQLEAARAERDSNRDSWLRTQAELENYRKRVQREREQDFLFRALPLAGDLLPVVDNLRRAIAAAEQSQNVDELRQGVDMVLRQFEEALAKHSISPIDASAGQPFDPNFHEAIQQIPSPEHAPMTVLQELERGYRIHDRVLRPSKVIVSSGPPQ